MFRIPLGCIICKYSIDARDCGIGGSVPTNKTTHVTSMIIIPRRRRAGRGARRRRVSVCVAAVCGWRAPGGCPCVRPRVRTPRRPAARDAGAHRTNTVIPFKDPILEVGDEVRTYETLLGLND